MQKINVGVIGVGYLGEHHARIYADIEGVELVAVSDVNEDKSLEIARKYGCSSRSSYTDILDLCDAVSIVTPTPTHYSIAMDCIAAGKDILIEKPITGNLQEAGEIIDAASARNCILQVGHLERFNPGLIAASEMISNPKFIESERLSPFLGRGIDVDVTLDLMIHDIDVMMSIVSSEISDMRAVGESILSDNLDVAKVWIEFESGCKGLITASRLASEKVRRIKIHQKDCFIVIDYQAQEIKRYSKSGKTISLDSLKPETKEPLREELQDFIRCVKTRQKPRVTGVDGAKALEIALRINSLLKGPPRSSNPL